MGAAASNDIGMGKYGQRAEVRVTPPRYPVSRLHHLRPNNLDGLAVSSMSAHVGVNEGVGEGVVFAGAGLMGAGLTGADTCTAACAAM